MERLTKRGEFGVFEWSDYVNAMNDPIPIGRTCREIIGAAEELGIKLNDIPNILKAHKEAENDET